MEEKEITVVGVLRAFFESPKLTLAELKACPQDTLLELAEMAAEAMGLERVGDDRKWLIGA